MFLLCVFTLLSPVYRAIASNHVSITAYILLIAGRSVCTIYFSTITRDLYCNSSAICINDFCDSSVPVYMHAAQRKRFKKISKLITYSNLFIYLN